jgi:hypothetical protein
MGIGFGYKIIWVLGMGIGFGYKIIWVLGMGIGFGYIYPNLNPKPKTQKFFG